MSGPVRIVVMARYPEPGRCKTRLIPRLGAGGAAALHGRLAERTVATVRASGLPFEVWGTGAAPSAFAAWLGDVAIRAQPGGDLGARLRAAAPPYPVIFLGTDAPDLAPRHLHAAAGALASHDAVIGPAHDGGYWTLGLAAPADSLLTDIPWGTGEVYRMTRMRMEAAGMVPQVLETLHDLDRPGDLDRWPHLLP